MNKPKFGRSWEQFTWWQTCFCHSAKSRKTMQDEIRRAYFQAETSRTKLEQLRPQLGWENPFKIQTEQWKSDLAGYLREIHCDDGEKVLLSLTKLKTDIHSEFITRQKNLQEQSSSSIGSSSNGLPGCAGVQSVPTRYILTRSEVRIMVIAGRNFWTLGLSHHERRQLGIFTAYERHGPNDFRYFRGMPLSKDIHARAGAATISV